MVLCACSAVQQYSAPFAHDNFDLMCTKGTRLDCSQLWVYLFVVVMFSYKAIRAGHGV